MLLYLIWFLSGASTSSSILIYALNISYDFVTLFFLQADTMEDLHEWKAALENALTQAPSASHVMGQNGIFRNDHADPAVGVDEKSMFVTFSMV